MEARIVSATFGYVTCRQAAGNQISILTYVVTLEESYPEGGNERTKLIWYLETVTVWLHMNHDLVTRVGVLSYVEEFPYQTEVALKQAPV